jgi:hypothetical protein
MRSPTSAAPLGPALVLLSCGLSLAAQTEQVDVTYHLESAKPLSRFNSDQIALLEKLNRADGSHLAGLPHLIVPERWDLEELEYSPMPQSVPRLSTERKALVIDIPGQVFGGYESGELVRWGPVNTGDNHHQTPPGRYYLNWNSRLRTSSENSDWLMPWYFNFSTERGFGAHQYSMPGRPMSHGCVRMLDVDARWLFKWGKGWTRSEDGQTILEHGTPLLIVGKYDFGSPRPWLQPVWWSQGITLSAPEMASLR